MTNITKKKFLQQMKVNKSDQIAFNGSIEWIKLA